MLKEKLYKHKVERVVELRKLKISTSRKTKIMEVLNTCTIHYVFC